MTVSVKFILNEIEKARESLSKKREFLTKYCNEPQSSSAAWLTAQDVNKCFDSTGKTLEDFRHTYALTGIDLSQTTDLTAALVLIQKDGVLWFFVRFYMPRNKLEEASSRDGIPYEKYVEQGYLILSGENVVDYHDVENWYQELVKKYEILPQKNGYDRYSAAYLVQDLEAQGFHMESVSQGSNMTGVIIDTEGMIKDGKLKSAEENNLMKIHMMDSALKYDETNRRRLVKVSRMAHIDGMAALIDAMTVRQKWYGEIGEMLKNGEDNGDV